MLCYLTEVAIDLSIVGLSVFLLLVYTKGLLWIYERRRQNNDIYCDIIVPLLIGLSDMVVIFYISTIVAKMKTC
jgi:hypothetical protein